jgi:uncharacterized Zn-finger protein
LTKHVSTVHEGKKPFKCDICDYSFSEKGSLNKHIKSVHDGNNRYKCEICEKTFSLMQSMKLHFSRVHEQKKPTRKICRKKI